MSSTLSLSKNSIQKDVPCPVCPLAKQKRLKFVSNNHLSANPFDLIHLDVWGSFSQESVSGYRYFLTIVDDCTRVTWVYFLKSKSDVLSIFPSFVTLVQTQYRLIKAIRSDNAPELAFTKFLKSKGIFHFFSCVDRP